MLLFSGAGRGWGSPVLRACESPIAYRAMSVLALGSGSGGAHGDARVIQHEAGFVVDQSAREVERWGAVVVALVPVLVADAHVLLFEAFDAQVESSYIRGRRLRPLAGRKVEAVHRQGVGHRRGLQVHVEAAVQVRRRPSIDMPSTSTVGLEKDGARPGAG